MMPPEKNYRLLLMISSLIFTALFIACQDSPAKEATVKETTVEKTPVKDTTTMIMSDMGRLQGVWEGQGPGGPCTITISNDTLTYRQPSQSEDNQFWYETVFKLVDSGDQTQLHATITRNNSDDHIGSVVVNTFNFKSDSLFLGVLKSFEGTPTELVTGDWSTAIDKYSLKRVKP